MVIADSGACPDVESVTEAPEILIRNRFGRQELFRRIACQRDLETIKSYQMHSSCFQENINHQFSSVALRRILESLNSPLLLLKL